MGYYFVDVDTAGVLYGYGIVWMPLTYFMDTGTAKLAVVDTAGALYAYRWIPSKCIL